MNNMWVVICCALSLPQVMMRMLNLKILNFITKLVCSHENFHLVTNSPIYLQSALNICPKRLRRLQGYPKVQSPLPHKKSFFIPTVTLYSTTISLGDQIGDCSLALGRKLGAQTLFCVQLHSYLFSKSLPHGDSSWIKRCSEEVLTVRDPAALQWCFHSWWLEAVGGNRTLGISD